MCQFNQDIKTGTETKLNIDLRSREKAHNAIKAASNPFERGEKKRRDLYTYIHVIAASLSIVVTPLMRTMREMRALLNPAARSQPFHIFFLKESGGTERSWTCFVQSGHVIN